MRFQIGDNTVACGGIGRGEYGRGRAAASIRCGPAPGAILHPGGQLMFDNRYTFGIRVSDGCQAFDDLGLPFPGQRGQDGGCTFRAKIR
jgi:hypothetical protein